MPVIYHDFCVGETGIDAPVHTLTLEQVRLCLLSYETLYAYYPKFLSVSEHSTPRGSRPGSPDRYNRFPDSSSSANGTNGTNSAPRTASSLLRRTRSMSLKAGDTSQYDAHERMKYTRNYKIKGFKGNSRGTSIQGPFTTLEEVFKRLPSNVGFNIELSEYSHDKLSRQGKH